MSSVLLAADFRGEDVAGWSLGEGVSMRVGDGALQARCIPEDEAHMLIESEDAFEDIDAQVSLEWTMLPADPDKAAAWSGIAVRASDDGYYLAAISTDGKYSVYWYTDDDSGALVDDEEHAAIKGSGPNVLRVVASGNQLAFYCNGELLCTTEDGGDEPFTEGTVGLVLISTEQPVGVCYRDLVLRDT